MLQFFPSQVASSFLSTIALTRLASNISVVTDASTYCEGLQQLETVSVSLPLSLFLSLLSLSIPFCPLLTISTVKTNR